MKNIDEAIFSKEKINRINKKILSIGPDTKITTTNFLMSRLFIEIALFIGLLFIPKYGFFIAIILTIIFHFLYELILLDNNITIQSKYIFDDSLSFFEMVKVSLASTNDIRVSLDIVSNKNNSNFSKIFRKVLNKHKYNNDISLVFKDMIDRITNEDIIASLTDLSLTSDYANTLDKIINNLREKEVLLAKEKSSMLPFRLSVISLSLIIAIILIIVFLPNILDVVG